MNTWIIIGIVCGAAWGFVFLWVIWLIVSRRNNSQKFTKRELEKDMQDYQM